MNFRVFVAAGFLLQGALCARAAVLTVTSLADVGAGSLRDRVASSAAGDTIQFAVTGTITLSSAITITHTLDVQGPGAAALIVDPNHIDRAFITSGSPVVISGMTITNGFVLGTTGADAGIGGNGMPGGNAYGGAILNQALSTGPSLVVSNCWLVGNLVRGGPGGRGGNNVIGITYFRPGTGGEGRSAAGAAIFSSGNGDVELANCTFSANRAVGGTGGTGGTNVASASDTGGTGGAGGSGGAGAVSSDAPTTDFTTCTFSGNRAGGGIGGTGGSNTDGGPGGTGGAGGDGIGGAVVTGIYFQNHFSCTIVSNAAISGIGGTGGNGTPAGASGTAGTGIGGGVVGYTAACLNPIANTILADNDASNINPNYRLAPADVGYNFIGTDDNGGCPWNSTSRAGTITIPLHPLLGPLAQNGGGIPTHATTLTSPVTDAGFSFGQTMDERGAPRPYDFVSIPNFAGGDGSDIGAFELGSTEVGLGMAGNNVVLSWPAYYGDLMLESATNLQGSNNWSNVVEPAVRVGSQLIVTLPAKEPIRFFRLSNP
jgi:hypothetical protein